MNATFSDTVISDAGLRVVVGVVGLAGISAGVVFVIVGKKRGGLKKRDRLQTASLYLE